MNVKRILKLLNSLRERYSKYAFTLKKTGSWWALRCYRNHREKWSVVGRRSEIVNEMEFLLS